MKLSNAALIEMVRVSEGLPKATDITITNVGSFDFRAEWHETRHIEGLETHFNRKIEGTAFVTIDTTQEVN